MPDGYAAIEDAAVQERLADVQELRAADPKQQAMLASYLDELGPRPGSRVLEIGCGTGAVARTIARRPQVREVVAVDPSEVFRARARSLAGDVPNLSSRSATVASSPTTIAEPRPSSGRAPSARLPLRR